MNSSRPIRQIAAKALFFLTAAVSSIYFLVLYILPPLREYNRFYLQNFDFGILFQSTYLLSRFTAPYLTTRGVHAWADNQDYFQVFLSFLHHLPASHYLLIGLHSLVIFSIGLFCLLYLKSLSRTAAIGVAIAVWSSPMLLNMNMDLFHTEAFAPIFILMLYHASKKGNTALFYIFLLLALSCKEDVALTVGFFSLLAFLAYKRFALHRYHFGLGFIIAVAIFFINIKLALPYYRMLTCLWLNPDEVMAPSLAVNPAAPFFQGIFTNIFQPSFLKDAFLRPEVNGYIFMVMWPTLFFVRRWPIFILLPAAGIFVNIVSKSDYFIQGLYHYDYTTMTAVIIIILEAMHRMKYRGVTAIFLALAAVYMNLHIYTVRTPVNSFKQPHFFKFVKNENVKFFEKLNSILPEGTVISADYNALNYLIAGHPEVFMFPVPFRESYFGLYGQCAAFSQKPEVDLVMVRKSYDFKPDMLEELNCSFESIDLETPQYMIWASGKFLSSKDSERFREVVAKINNKDEELRDAICRQPEILQNGDFETLDKDNSPLFWTISSWQDESTNSVYDVVNSDEREGGSVARIVHDGAADSRWVQTVKVEPDTEYYLSGWLKTDNVPDQEGGAYLSVEDGPVMKTKVLFGSNGWQFLEAFGKTAEDQTEVKIQCRLGDYGNPTSGTIYCDDVQFRKVPAPVAE